MRRSPLLAVAAAASVLALSNAPARAQSVQERLELTREAVENRRRILVSGALPLTEEEGKAFWPLYDAYEKERRALDVRATKLLADFVAQSATLTDAQAKPMVEDVLRIEEERARMRREYFPRMAKAVPPRKLLRFYQIENKLDAVVRADLSKQIPLVP